MTVVKYDASGDIPETLNAPVGMYRAKIKEAEARDSNAGNAMVVITWELTHVADGKKVKEDYWPVRLYLMVEDDRAYAKRTIRDFNEALGFKPKGSWDLKKLIGKAAQLKLKSDTDQDGEYQPRIGKVLALGDGEAEAEPEPEDEPEPEEEPEEEAVDLDPMDRDELKAFIKEEGLGTLKDLGITKSTTDAEIRKIIVEAMGGEAEPEDEPEAEPEPEDEPEDDGYDDMSPAELKKECKERELATAGAKKVLIARLRKDDAEEPF